MKIIPLLVLAAAAACAKAPEYAPYRSTAGYTLEVPSAWRVDADPVPDRKPATNTFFVGPVTLSVGRFVRRSADADYQKGFLKPTIKLFGDDAPAPARKAYSRGVAIRTADAYYLIECRAEKANQPLCAAALEHALKTFAPLN